MRVQNLHSHRSDTMQMWLLLTHNEIKVFLKSLKNVIPKPLSWFRFSTENDTKIFVRPIFRFWLLVSFGNEVTKIWKYFVIFFYILQGKKSKMEIQRKENHEAKVTKKPKMKLPKYVMSWALVNSFKLFSSIFNYFSLDWNTFESLLWIPKLL